MSDEQKITARGQTLTDYLAAKEQYELTSSRLKSFCQRLQELERLIAAESDDADLDMLADKPEVKLLMKERAQARERKASLAASLRHLGLENVE